MTFEVRLATTDDIDGLHEQCREQAAAHEGMLQYFTVTKADLRAEMDSPHVRILVISPTTKSTEEDKVAPKKLAGHLIGLYFVDSGAQRSVDYASLFVSPEYRGRGLATALLAEGSKLARRKGATSAEILVQTTGPEGPARLDMYYHYGFENHTLLHNRCVYELYPEEHEAVLRLAESRRSEIDMLRLTTTPPTAAANDNTGGGVFCTRTITVSASEPSNGNDAAKFAYRYGFCPFDGRSIDIVSMWFAENVDVGLILLTVSSYLIKRYGEKLWIDVASAQLEPVKNFLTALMFEDITEEEDWNVLELPTTMFNSLAERKLRADIRSRIE